MGVQYACKGKVVEYGPEDDVCGEQARGLQTDAERLEHALRRELGDEMPLETALGDTSQATWRGRAQQISLLRAQLADLRAAHQV